MERNREYRVEGEYFSSNDLREALLRLEDDGFRRPEILIMTKTNNPKVDEIRSLSRVTVREINELPKPPSFFERIIDAVTVEESETDEEAETLLDFGIDMETARRFNEGLANNSALILVDTKAPTKIESDHVSYVNQQIFDDL